MKGYRWQPFHCTLRKGFQLPSHARFSHRSIGLAASVVSKGVVTFRPVPGMCEMIREVLVMRISLDLSIEVQRVTERCVNSLHIPAMPDDLIDLRVEHSGQVVGHYDRIG